MWLFKSVLGIELYKITKNTSVIESILKMYRNSFEWEIFSSNSDDLQRYTILEICLTLASCKQTY